MYMFLHTLSNMFVVRQKRIMSCKSDSKDKAQKKNKIHPSWRLSLSLRCKILLSFWETTFSSRTIQRKTQCEIWSFSKEKNHPKWLNIDTYPRLNFAWISGWTVKSSSRTVPFPLCFQRLMFPGFGKIWKHKRHYCFQMTPYVFRMPLMFPRFQGFSGALLEI